MASFLDLLSYYAIWIYIAGVVGILFGIKTLVDSRRTARTTMFTLEQEQAGDRAFRAILIMLVFILLIGSVTAVNAFVGPARPTPVPAIAKQGVVSFTPPVILLTDTPIATFVAESSNPPIEVVAPTATMVLGTGGGLTQTPVPPPTVPTRVVKTLTPTKVPVQPTASPVQNTPVPTSAPTQPPVKPASMIYPAPPLQAPENGSTVSREFLQFIWGKQDVPTQLPSGQFYKVLVQYTDRTTNLVQVLVQCTDRNSTTTKNWQPMVDARGRAVDATYRWSVIVMEAASSQQCEAGNGTSSSPRSDVWSFKWP